MFKARNLLITSSLAAALFGTSAAMAAGPIHPGSGEKGVTEYPSHQVLNNSRAEVVAQRNAAKQNFGPTGDAMDYPAPVARVGGGLSRDQVERETLRAMKAGQIRMGEGS